MKLCHDIFGLWKLFWAGVFIDPSSFNVVHCPRSIVDSWMPTRTIIIRENVLPAPTDPPLKPLPTAKGLYPLCRNMCGMCLQLNDSLNTGYSSQWFIIPLSEDSTWGFYMVVVNSATVRRLWPTVLALRNKLCQSPQTA